MTTRSMGTTERAAAVLAVTILRENVTIGHIYTIDHRIDGDGVNVWKIVETAANGKIASASDFLDGVLFACEYFFDNRKQ